MRHFFNKLLRNIEEMLHNIHLFVYVFLKAKVHRYFLIMLFLMVISAIIFMVIEADQVREIAAEIDDEGLSGGIVNVFFWSVITILSHHYYSMFTLSMGSRILVVLMIFFSMITVSIFIGNVASALTSKKMLENRGIIEISKLKDHYIICGWKKFMGKFIETIIDNNPSISLKKIAVLANIETSVIELFRQNHPHLKDIVINRGNHYNESLLKTINANKAQKVLILADETCINSNVGIDSLTVLTAVTVRSLNKNVPITAELIDIRFEKYLKTAHVDETIYKTEYNMSLVAGSLQQVGLTKVINDLLIKHNTGSLKTLPVPVDLYEKTFSDLKGHYKQSRDALVIGVIENAGNLLVRKREAIRSAQKTADVSVLINNLKAAKQIENNLPHFLPEDDYIIPYNSLAIIIQKENRKPNVTATSLSQAQ